jgi:hypothetical protein
MFGALIRFRKLDAHRQAGFVPVGTARTSLYLHVSNLTAPCQALRVFSFSKLPTCDALSSEAASKAR